MNGRWISIACWTVSALLIGGDLLWIALAEDKGTAIFGGIIAVGVSRVLIGEIAVRYDQQASTDAEAGPEEPPAD